jgi:hypothetical protein
MLGNSFVTRNNGVTGKRCSPRDPFQQLRDAATEELLGEVFSMRSVPRPHMKSIVRCELVILAKRPRIDPSC